MTTARSTANRRTHSRARHLIYRGKHNVTIGGDFRKQEYNDNSPAESARGIYVYRRGDCGACGERGERIRSCDFLIGVPDASAIAFGNADKYFREPVYDVYFNDDWRVMPILTINAGVRWDYSAPITELFGRLVNLDVASGFSAVAPVVGSDPVGSLTGAHYPSSLMRPERRMIEPRIGITWRPIPASTVVIRAGYGIYQDTSVYQSIVLQHGAAGAAVKEPECGEQRGMPADSGQWICACASVGDKRYVWHRSQLPHRLRAAVAVGGAARFAVRAADDGDLYGNQRHARARRRFCPTAIRWAKRIPARVARRDLCTKHRTGTRSGRRDSCSCGAGCAADLPHR